MTETVRDPLPFRPFAPGTQPEQQFPQLRKHAQAPPDTGAGKHGPYDHRDFRPALLPRATSRAMADISVVDGRPAMGERIVVRGRVTDEDRRPVPETMIEIWQANAAGRYHHARDRHDAPLDPNFRGIGRVFTDAEGRYRFTSVKPGAYPWGNHKNAWRPNHIHFSFFGPAFRAVITQMYFPGDPLLELDPSSTPCPTRRRATGWSRSSTSAV